MKSFLSTLSSILIATLLLFGSPANAAYTAFDNNDDGLLDENEYVDYSYDVIDYNDDGLLDDDEWYDYSSVWYEPYDIDYDSDLGAFDADNDGYIDEDEYADNYDSDLFNEWDADNSGFVDDKEYEEVATLYDDADEDGLFDF